MRVITWQSPGGDQVDITPRQARAFRATGRWPRDSAGQEFCRVSRGARSGFPTWTDDQIRRHCAGEIDL